MYMSLTLHQHQPYTCIIIHVLAVLYSGTSLYCGHHWDRLKCPDYRGVLISEVACTRTYFCFGTPESVRISKCPV